MGSKSFEKSQPDSEIQIISSYKFLCRLFEKGVILYGVMLGSFRIIRYDIHYSNKQPNGLLSFIHLLQYQV